MGCAVRFRKTCTNQSGVYAAETFGSLQHAARLGQRSCRMASKLVTYRLLPYTPAFAGECADSSLVFIPVPASDRREAVVYVTKVLWLQGR